MSASMASVHGSRCLRAARTIAKEQPRSHQSHQFSTSVPRWPRGVKGTNKLRGLSVTRASGPIHKRIRSIKPYELPVPVMDPARRATVQTSPDHGLWGFFNQNKESLTAPKDLSEHGRGWTKKELRIKSLDDMHILWWKCHLELNRLATETQERKRLEPGYGQYELEQRQTALRDTQKAIRETLQERYEAWQEAQDIVNKGQDPDIAIDGDGQAVMSAPDPYDVDEMETDRGVQPMTSSPPR